jgi:hypothetical protein
MNTINIKTVHGQLPTTNEYISCSAQEARKNIENIKDILGEWTWFDGSLLTEDSKELKIDKELHTSNERRKYFSKLDHRKSVFFEPDKLYNFEVWL